MSKPHFNATLRDGQVDGLPVDAIPAGRIPCMPEQGCAVSVDDSNTMRVTNKLQIQMKKMKQSDL